MLTAFSATGARAASTRTRLLAWLNRIDPEWQWHQYLGSESYSLHSMRNPLPALRAEAALVRQRHDSLERAVIHREVSPNPTPYQEKLVRARSERLVLDLDDALFAGGRTHLGRWRRRKYQVVAERADCVIAGNEYLAEWAANYCDTVVVIPTCIEPADYINTHDEVSVDVEQNAVVWLGSPSGEPYLRLVAEPLSAFLAASNLSLHVISTGSDSLGPLDPFVKRVEWRPGVESILSNYLFGIAPLPTTDFTVGKSAYKLLQYGAAGLPFISSPVGANASIAERIGGLSARSDQEWNQYFWDIFRMPREERRNWSASLRTLTCAHYSYERWLPDWTKAVGL